MPGQDGAFDARREFVNAGRDGELADVCFCFASRDQLVDAIKHFANLISGLAFDAFREERSGGLGDAAAGAHETDVFDYIAVHGEEELQLITTERIMALSRASRAGHLMKIARLLAMIEDDLLVEIV